MANLLVEAGNTALKAAWAEGTTLGKTFRYQGEKMMDFLLSLLEKERPEVLTVASVYGVSEAEEAILRPLCGHLLILDRAHTDLLIGRDYPEHLSFDRAASLVAAGFLGVRSNLLRCEGAADGRIPVWRVTSGDVTVSVSRRGGYVVQAIAARTPTRSVFSEKGPWSILKWETAPAQPLSPQSGQTLA